MEKTKLRKIYIFNIIVFLVLVLFNVVVHYYSHVEIVKSGDITKVVVVKTYSDYFFDISVISLVLMIIVVLISMLYITREYRLIQKRTIYFSGLFSSANLETINLLEATTSQERIILETWNDSIDELNDLKNKQKQYFNSMIHDFKMPIQISKSNIELYNLKNGEDPNINNVEKQLIKLQSDINRILILEKIEYFENPRCDQHILSKLVNDYISEVGSLDVEFNINNVNDFEVNTDKAMFFKICNNLIDNISKYSIDKKAHITINTNSLIIRNQCSAEEDYFIIYNEKRMQSDTGNGLGNKIISIYANKLNIKMNSSCKQGQFITVLEFPESKAIDN